MAINYGQLLDDVKVSINVFENPKDLLTQIEEYLNPLAPYINGRWDRTLAKKLMLDILDSRKQSNLI